MIAILNLSSQVSHADARSIATACAVQMEHHFAPDYSRRPPMPTLYLDVATIPQGAPTITIVDQGDDVGALGYHTQTGGRVVGLVGVTDILAAGGTMAKGAVSVSAVLSHECLEAAFDPFVNKWIQDRSGRLWAAEIGDPCQNYTYSIQGIDVSDYVLPHFWNADPPSGVFFDRLHYLTDSFQVAPGGYAILRQPDGSTTELGAKPAWRKGYRSIARCQGSGLVRG